MRRGAASWPKEPIKERECSGCGGTGFMAVAQPKTAAEKEALAYVRKRWGRKHVD